LPISFFDLTEQMAIGQILFWVYPNTGIGTFANGHGQFPSDLTDTMGNAE
jgi:hypothetical protein